MEELINMMISASVFVLIIGLIALIIGIILYVIQAIFLNKFHKLVFGKGTVLPWIPIANIYLLGKLTFNNIVGYILLSIFLIILISPTIISMLLPNLVLVIGSFISILFMIYSIVIVALYIYAIIKYFKLKKQKSTDGTNSTQQNINNQANSNNVINQTNTNIQNNQINYETLETLGSDITVNQSQVSNLEITNIQQSQNFEQKPVEQIKKVKPEYMNKIYIVIVLIVIIMVSLGVLIFFGLKEEENTSRNKTTTTSTTTTTQNISSTSTTTINPINSTTTATPNSSTSSTTTSPISSTTTTTTTTTSISQIDEEDIAYNAITKYLDSFYIDNYLKTYKIEEVKILEEIECYNLTEDSNKLYVYAKLSYEKINLQLEIIPNEEKIDENKYLSETYFVVNKTNNSIANRKNIC